MSNDDEIQRAARALREQERYQEQLQATNAAGESTYKDQWGKALDGLATVSDGKIDPADFSAILGTDDPAKVIFELGSNAAEYQRIMALPPAKRQIEIVKISIKQAPRAAPPVASNAEPLSEKAADDDWYAARKKQKAERFERERAAGRR